MISFRPVRELDATVEAQTLGTDADIEYLEDILESFRELEGEGVQVGATTACDCLLVRVLSEGKYMFVYPIALSEDADALGACREISEYSRRELLPLTFTDVPREELSSLGQLFPHMNAAAYEDDDDMFFVSVRNESDRAGGEAFEFEDIVLDFLADTDREPYARLCSDAELNRFWGYDASVDNPSGDPDMYLAVARREYEDGVAIALAVRHNGCFVGEAVIYDFDYVGSAAIGVRILPEHHGRGLGAMATRALIAFSKRLGLKRLRTTVMEENIPSVRMTGRLMNELSREAGRVSFELVL